MIRWVLMSTTFAAAAPIVFAELVLVAMALTHPVPWTGALAWFSAWLGSLGLILRLQISAERRARAHWEVQRAWAVELGLLEKRPGEDMH